MAGRRVSFANSLPNYSSARCGHGALYQTLEYGSMSWCQSHFVESPAQGWHRRHHLEGGNDGPCYPLRFYDISYSTITFAEKATNLFFEFQESKLISTRRQSTSIENAYVFHSIVTSPNSYTPYRCKRMLMPEIGRLTVDELVLLT